MLLKPWIHLCRFHKPTGTFLLFCPCLWSSLMVHGGCIFWPDLILLLAGCLWARSLGCIHNDIVDCRIDVLVLRTCDRPLAAGDLSLPRAKLAAGILLLLGCPFLFLLPARAVFWGMVGVGIALLYPFCKRWMKVPQLILAISFNTSVFLAASLANSPLRLSVLLLFIAGCLWTIEYDLIYAYQDYQDDKRLGIGSLAVVCQEKGHDALYGLMGIRTLCFWMIGIDQKASFFFMMAHGLFSVATVFLYNGCALDDPAQCKRLFSWMPVLGFLIAGFFFWV